MSEDMVNVEKFASFEATLTRLQEIVSTLEQGNVSLDTAMKSYKEGMLCARQCRKVIQDARHEISVWQDGEDIPFAQAADGVREIGAES